MLRLVRGQARGETAGPEQAKRVDSGQVSKAALSGTDPPSSGRVSCQCSVLAGATRDAFIHPSPAQLSSPYRPSG